MSLKQIYAPTIKQKMDQILAKILQKAGLNQEQADAAKEGQIVNGCLFLLQKTYKHRTFMSREDINFVIAKHLVSVAGGMFYNCSQLELVHMPNVENIKDAKLKNYPGCFCCTALTEIVLPKLKHAGVLAFGQCSELVSADLPLCLEVGS